MSRFVQILHSVTVEPVLLVFMLCTFLKLPVNQQLIFRKTCIQMYNVSFCRDNFTSETCKHSTAEENAVQKSSSEWLFYQSVAYSIPSIVSSLLLGSWSDKFGRKTVILLPLIGLCIETISSIVNAHFFSASPLHLLYGNILSGLFGGFSTILMALFSYIADITKDKKSERTLRIGLLESMTFIGGTTGELLSGLLIDHFGFMVPFIVNLSLVIVVIFYIVFGLPESYFPPHRSNLFSLDNFHGSIKVCIKPRAQNKRIYLILLLIIGFFIPLLVFTGTNDVIILFVLHHPFCFSSSMIGYFLAVGFAVKSIGVIIGVPVMTRILKMPDTYIVIAGIFTNIVSTVFITFTTSTWQVFLAISSGIFNGVTIPSVRAMMSKLVDFDEQGSLFAVVAGISSVSSLIASLIFNNIYKVTVSTLPGLCFLIMSGMLLLPLFLMIFLRVHEEEMNTTLEVNDGETLIESEESSA